MTLLRDIEISVKRQERPAILVYAGDFDASGESIQADFARRAQSIKLLQIALTEEQVATYNLPINEGKASDPRSARFVQKHGRLIQVELDALPPDVLHRLYADAISRYWDDEAYADAVAQETEEREHLIRIAATMTTE